MGKKRQAREINRVGVAVIIEAIADLNSRLEAVEEAVRQIRANASWDDACRESLGKLLAALRK